MCWLRLNDDHTLVYHLMQNNKKKSIQSMCASFLSEAADQFCPLLRLCLQSAWRGHETDFNHVTVHIVAHMQTGICFSYYITLIADEIKHSVAKFSLRKECIMHSSLTAPLNWLRVDRRVCFENMMIICFKVKYKWTSELVYWRWRMIKVKFMISVWLRQSFI